MRADGKTLYRVKLQEGVSLQAALAQLRADATIDYAEPNWIYEAMEVVPEDEHYVNGNLWGMYGAASPLHTNPYGSHAAQAWRDGQLCGEGVYVGIIDSGVMPDHEDLKKNVWNNPFDPVDGIDNDGNGKVDDAHGWDFCNNDRSVFDHPVIDLHGTRVAGVIGARGNTKGVIGVCPGVTMIIAKILDPRKDECNNAKLAKDAVR
jgi:subtilisin family serine protease